MNNNKSIGEILRDARKRKGLLLRHVCAELDVDTAILSKVERNERKATKDQILKLATILELDRDELLIQYFSDRIVYEIQEEELGLQALKVAEEKIKYNIKNKP